MPSHPLHSPHSAVFSLLLRLSSPMPASTRATCLPPHRSQPSGRDSAKQPPQLYYSGHPLHDVMTAYMRNLTHLPPQPHQFITSPEWRQGVSCSMPHIRLRKNQRNSFFSFFSAQMPAGVWVDAWQHIAALMLRWIMSGYAGMGMAGSWKRFVSMDARLGRSRT